MFGSARRAIAVRYLHPLVLVLGLIAINGPAVCQAAPPYKVDPQGGGGIDFTTIQAALDSPGTTGQTILIAPGIYRYTDEIRITGKDAPDILSPTILKADNGEVIIDCADPYGAESWTQHSGNVYKATRLASVMTVPLLSNQDAACYVFVDDIRYAYKDTTDYDEGSLKEGSWAYHAGDQLVYVRLIGGGSPSGRDIYISDDNRINGLNIKQSDNFVIDGITVRHAPGTGILFAGSSTTGVPRDRLVAVKNCKASHCFKAGIQLSRTASSSVQNNTSFLNGDHGIFVTRSDSVSITGNTSYLNDSPLPPIRGGKNGIRVGSGDSTLVADINVDYNTAYENEDSGFEVNGAKRVVVRRNLSYKNRDHGADNLSARGVSWMNNVLFSNDHDGFSVENTSRHVSLFNNLLLHNARNPSTLADTTTEMAELAIADTTDFVSQRNVVWALPGKDVPDKGDLEDRFVAIVDIQGGGGAKKYYSFLHYQTVTGFDALSDTTMPSLVDTLSYNFRLNSGTTYSVDAARTDMTGWRSPMWLAVDRDGIGLHNAAKSNAGAGTPAYADIGAFEYDPRPGLDTLTATCEELTQGQWRLDFKAVSDDSVSNGDPVAAYDLKWSTSSITEGSWGTATSLGGPTPLGPGANQIMFVQPPMEARYYALKSTDANGHASGLSTVVLINPIGFTCNNNWYGGGGGGGGGEHEDPLRGPTLSSLRRVGASGAAENSILNGTPVGTRGTDLLPIEAVQNDEGSYLAYLRVTGRQGTLVDGLKLLFVDHPKGTEAFACGAGVLAGRRSQVSHAVTETGANVTKLLNGTGGVFDAAGTVAVTIVTPLDSLQTPLVIECSNDGMRGQAIIVESESPAGWQEVGSVYPRRWSAATVIDAVPPGPVRLRFTGHSYVSSVARLASEAANVTRTWGTLVSAKSSSAGEVLSAVGIEDTASTVLVGPDSLLAAFSGPPVGQEVVRSLFLGVAATPLTASAATSYAAARQSSVPTQFALYQNAPNPFWGSTAIRLDLPVGRMVKLEIFDVSGRRVRTLVNRFMPAGRQSVMWDQRDDAGATLGAGVYFSRLQVDTFRDRKKLTLMP